MCHLLEAARRHVAKVALEDAKRRALPAQLFGGYPQPHFSSQGTRCSWPRCPLLLSAGWGGDSDTAGAGRAPCRRPGPLLCLSGNLYKRKRMFPFKLTKAETGAREAL